jgi:hypothetical protein
MPAAVSNGTLLALSAGTPATFDAAGYAALTFTVLGEVTDPGEMGETWSVATHVPLANGRTQKFKSTRDAGQQTIQLALDTDDAGQILAKAASLSTSNYSFRMTMPNGDIYYSRGLVTSFTVSPGSAGDITPATLVVDRNYSGTLPHIEALSA